MLKFSAYAYGIGRRLDYQAKRFSRPVIMMGDDERARPDCRAATRFRRKFHTALPDLRTDSAHRRREPFRIQPELRSFLRRRPVALRLPRYFRQFDTIKG
jgi:hypothetical protein